MRLYHEQFALRLCGSAREKFSLSSVVWPIFPFLQVIQRLQNHIGIQGLPAPLWYARFRGNVQALAAVFSGQREDVTAVTSFGGRWHELSVGVAEFGLGIGF
ncbi:MAG: hypothetical protein EA370_05330 [Wenzhouxiangella sp.]|nr:MAG: hypothetical protein EA370_05330 [Wenzhouxiangella sp.]